MTIPSVKLLLCQWLCRGHKPGEEPRVVLLDRIDRLCLDVADLEKERDYYRGQVDRAIRAAEVAEDQVDDIRHLTDRERGRGDHRP